jgi:nucleotide-binding universal stress UspA family protein
VANFSKALFILESDFTRDDSALRKALRFAKINNVTLDFISVLPNLAPMNYSNSSCAIQSLIEEATASIHSALFSFDKKLKYSLKVHVGKMHSGVITEVVNNKYDLVIKQSENPSWLHSIFGSNDLDLLRKCPCAVWLIHETAPEQYKTVLAAIDFSDDNDQEEAEFNLRIARSAAEFSVCNDANMHVVSAFNAAKSGYASLWADNPDKFERKYLDEEERRRRFSSMYLIDQMKKKQKSASIQALSVEQHIVEGQPEITIPAKADELAADLVVMGTIGRSGMLGMLLGNTSESVLLHLSCSVLALKPNDFEYSI